VSRPRGDQGQTLLVQVTFVDTTVMTLSLQSRLRSRTQALKISSTLKPRHNPLHKSVKQRNCKRRIFM
jgi:hypothetical protein